MELPYKFFTEKACYLRQLFSLFGRRHALSFKICKRKFVLNGIGYKTSSHAEKLNVYRVSQNKGEYMFFSHFISLKVKEVIYTITDGQWFNIKCTKLVE